MVVSGWDNGKRNDRTGGGYGIKMAGRDRDKHFRRAWASVVVELDNGEAAVARLSPSFWRKCPELRCATIGKWMLDQGLAPWSKGKPPRFRLEPTGDRGFRLSRL